MRVSGKVHGQWFRCRACRAFWEASAYHCIWCHQTFEHQPPNHRDKIRCIPPADLGWEQDNGRWHPPVSKAKTAIEQVQEAISEHSDHVKGVVKRAIFRKSTSDSAGDS